jgi:hypothetical protein
MSLRSAANADPYPPATSCAVSSSNHSVQGGDSLTVTGSGFPASSTVQLSVHSSTPIGLGSVHTDSHGSFTDKVKIPSSITGTGHRIVASAASTSCSFDPFATSGVDAVSTSRGSNSTASGGTASTGFAAVTATVIALVLLGGGLLFVVIGRRRSRV